MTKRAYEPPIESTRDLYHAGQKLHINKVFLEQNRQQFTGSPIEEERLLFEDAMANFEEQSYDMVEGHRPRRLYDALINGGSFIVPRACNLIDLI